MEELIPYYRIPSERDRLRRVAAKDGAWAVECAERGDVKNAKKYAWIAAHYARLAMDWLED